MIKTIFAIAFLSGSISAFANGDIYNRDTSTSSYPDHYDTDMTTSDEYSDVTTSSMSATEEYNPSADTTVTGTMDTGPSITEEYQKLHVGILSGIDSPEGSDTDASTEFGVDVGYQPTSIFGVGVEGTTTKLDRADETRRTMALVKGTARFGGDIPLVKDIFVGGAVGPVVTDEKWRVGGGPLVGFDIPLSNRAHDFLSLGLNAKYIFTTDTPDSLISAVALKYWF